MIQVLSLPHPLTSSILVAEVGETPHVAQADDGSCHRQDKLNLVAPLAPLLHLLLGGRQRVLGSADAIREAWFGDVSYKGGKRGMRLLQQIIEAG